MRGVEREPYPSDLSDEQWSLIEPMITAWKQDRVARSATGDPGSCDLREVVNAIFYQNRTGCQWRYLPHDLPSWSAVFYCFGLWRRDGLDQRIQELLRCQVRERARRLEDPSLVIIDTQSVRARPRVSRRPRRGWMPTRRCRAVVPQVPPVGDLDCVGQDIRTRPLPETDLTFTEEELFASVDAPLIGKPRLPPPAERAPAA